MKKKIISKIQDNRRATFQGVQYNEGATFQEWQDNEGATFKGWQVNRGATFEGWQYNEGATFKKWQDNERATLKKGMLIKDMVIINKNSELSKKIKKFSKNRRRSECTLTNFYEWLKEELKQEVEE